MALVTRARSAPARARGLTRGLTRGPVRGLAGSIIHGPAFLLFLAVVAPVLMPESRTPNLASEAHGEAGSGSSQTDQPTDSIAKTRQDHYFVGAYGGVPYTYPSDVRTTRPNGTDFTLHDVPWRGEPFKAPIYYGVRISRWSDRTPFGAMLDFTHSKAISNRGATVRQSGKINNINILDTKTKIKERFKKLEFSHGHNMLTLNGLYRLPARIGVISPYLGLGSGISIPHTEIGFREDLTRTYEYQYTGPAFQALFGLEFQLPKFSVFLEYKFTFADYQAPLTYRNGSWVIQDLWAQFNDWRAGKSGKNGTLSTKLTSHQLIGGLGLRIVPK